MKASLNLLEHFFADCNQSNWGYSDMQIADAETRLSISLPKILKQYYSKFGACPYLKPESGSNIAVLLALEHFFIPDSTYNAPHYVPEDLDFLVFSSFADVSAIDYGIRLSDLSLEDPPVYLCDYGSTSWTLANPSLLNFLITTTFWQIAYEMKLTYYLNISEIDYYEQNLESPDLNYYVTRLDMNDWELEDFSNQFRYYRIFLKDGIILACETDEWQVSTEPPSEYIMWLTVGSNNREKIQAIQKIPDLLWQNADI